MNLSAESLKKIEDEIERLESQVDVEFIPVVAEQSSYTEHVGLILAIIFMAVFAAIIEFTMGSDKIIFDLGAIVLAIILSRVLCRLNAVKRLFISVSERNRQVYEKARMIFFNRQFSEIKSANALLVYISMMEHRIEILPDPRMHMTQLKDMTDHCVNLLKSAFTDKDYEKGFISVIQYIQSQLHTQFPRKNPGENVVSNKLIWWQD